MTRLSDHVNYILPPEKTGNLRETFKKFTRCCLEEGHANFPWVHVNPKGQHVWVHYKGERLIYLRAAMKWFDVQYGRSPRLLRITADNCETEMVKCEEDIRKDLGAIDSEMRILFGNVQHAE